MVRVLVFFFGRGGGGRGFLKEEVKNYLVIPMTRPPDVNSDMNMRNCCGFQVRRASLARICCTPKRVLLHSPG